MLTLSAWSYDGLQNLLVVEDEDEAFGGANDQGRGDVQTGRAAKVAFAHFREDLTGDDLQLGPAHNLPWRLGRVCFVRLLLEEQIARERRLARVGRQKCRRCATRTGQR